MNWSKVTAKNLTEIDFDKVNKNGYTAMHYLAGQNQDVGVMSSNSLRLALDINIIKDININLPDKQGHTPLDHAILNQNIVAMRGLKAVSAKHNLNIPPEIYVGCRVNWVNSGQYKMRETGILQEVKNNIAKVVDEGATRASDGVLYNNIDLKTTKLTTFDVVNIHIKPFEKTKTLDKPKGLATQALAKRRSKQQTQELER